MTPIARRALRAAPPPPAARFVVGQRVLFTPTTMNPRAAANARYTVVRVLPGAAGRPTYRIKGDTETYERMVEESQLATPSFED